MKQVSANDLRELIADIETELTRLERLAQGIKQVRSAIQQEPELAATFYESLALKLHNFYTGCERIFQLITSELNGSIPSGYDWHKRLLERMSMERKDRPALISTIASAILVRTPELERNPSPPAKLESFLFVCGCDFLTMTNTVQSC